MERKLLVEVTEEEYQKIKKGILEEEPKVVTELKEIPVVKEKEKLVLMDKKAKFSIGDKVSFFEINFGNEKIKREGEIVGIDFTIRPPNFFEKKDGEKLTILYQVEYHDEKDSDFAFIGYMQEKDITLLKEQEG